MVDDPGNLSLTIGGSGYNLGKVRVEKADFATASGRPIPIDRIVYDQIYGSDFAIIKFFYKPGSYTSGEAFSVSLFFDAQGSKLRLSGKFSTHSHTKIEYLPEVLDHG